MLLILMSVKLLNHLCSQSSITFPYPSTGQGPLTLYTVSKCQVKNSEGREQKLQVGRVMLDGQDED